MTYSYRFNDGLCSLVFSFLVLWSSAGEKLIHHFLRVAQFFQFIQFIDLLLLRFCLVFMEFICYIYINSAIYCLEQDSCSIKDYLPYDRSPTKA